MLCRGHRKSQRFSRLNMHTRGKPVLPVETSRSAKRSCPLLTEVSVRRSLYLAIARPHLCQATEVWSPPKKTLKVKVEEVQRRSTRWILSLKPGLMSYGKRLLALDMLPLAYDRKIKDLVFFYKAVYGFIDKDVSNYVTFNNHPRTYAPWAVCQLLSYCSGL